MRWRHSLHPHPPTQASPLLLPSPPLNILCGISALLSCFLSFFLSPRLNFLVIFSTLGALSSLISPSAPSPPSPAPYFSILKQDRETPPTRTFSLFFLLFLRFSFFSSCRELEAACLSCCRLHTRTTQRGDRHTSPGCVRFCSALLWYRSAHQGVGVSVCVSLVCPISWEGELLVEPLQNLLGVVVMVVKF